MTTIDVLIDELVQRHIPATQRQLNVIASDRNQIANLVLFWLPGWFLHSREAWTLRLDTKSQLIGVDPLERAFEPSGEGLTLITQEAAGDEVGSTPGRRRIFAFRRGSAPAEKKKFWKS